MSTGPSQTRRTLPATINMIRHLFLAFLLLSMTETFAQSQSEFHLEIKSKRDSERLGLAQLKLFEYGLKVKDTISDLNGSFQITMLTSKVKKSYLWVSYSGHYPMKIKLDTLINENLVFLKIDTLALSSGGMESSIDRIKQLEEIDREILKWNSRYK